MKKPDNYKEMSRLELGKKARQLLDWNCEQPVSERLKRQHYEEEIQPLHDQIDLTWKNFWNKVDLT